MRPGQFKRMLAFVLKVRQLQDRLEAPAKRAVDAFEAFGQVMAKTQRFVTLPRRKVESPRDQR